MAALRDEFHELQQGGTAAIEELQGRLARIEAGPVAGGVAPPGGPPDPGGPGGAYTSRMPIIAPIIRIGIPPDKPPKPSDPQKPDFMGQLETVARGKMKREKTKRKARKKNLGNLYMEARRESHAGRKKERTDLIATAKEKISKVPRKQRRALREKLMGAIKARFKLFRQTFPPYRKLKSKDQKIVNRLIENLKTWRLGLEQ